MKENRRQCTNLLCKHVGRKVVWLQQLLMSNASSGKAIAAQMRRSVNHEIGSDPSVWEVTLGDLPVLLQGQGDFPSFAEQVTHLAICLYAVHQQSHAKPMHVKGCKLGYAIRDFISVRNGDVGSDPTIRRFNALNTSESVEEMAWHLRSIVLLLRSQGIPLDYVQLSADLFSFSFLDARDSVRLKWGRQLYSERRPTKGNTSAS